MISSSDSRIQALDHHPDLASLPGLRVNSEIVRETLDLLLARAVLSTPLPAFHGPGSAPTGAKKFPSASSASLSPPSSSLHM